MALSKNIRNATMRTLNTALNRPVEELDEHDNYNVGHIGFSKTASGWYVYVISNAAGGEQELAVGMSATELEHWVGGAIFGASTRNK